MPTVNRIQRPWLNVKKEEARHDPFYNSTPWRKLRAYVLTTNPLCKYCNLSGVLTPAVIGDHYRPKRLYPDLALDASNIVPCCDTCHQIKRGWEKTILSQKQFEEQHEYWLTTTFKRNDRGVGQKL